MRVRDTARAYPANKTSSNVRALEDVKNDMAWQKQTIQNLRERIQDYDSGWADDFDDNPRKKARMEQQLETAKENYAKLKTEYESHPDYYADKYKDVGGFEKAVTGILGSTIATVPVVVETTAAALKEAKAKGSAEDYTSALQAEKIAWNKMNDYAASYFGSFDTIDEDELDRLKQEHDRAVNYRKSIEAQYEQPVDMDSWGMSLMEESTWLKDSATENLEGIWKAGADAMVNEAQSTALLPLLLAGPKAYIAGLATNAAAEKMHSQTAKEKPAGEALLSGMASAGLEVAGEKLSDFLKKKGKSVAEWLEKVWEELD